MAGIYIHIPFCKKICYYCDFYKSANYRFVDEFVNCLLTEITLKKDFTKDTIETIYFGGGTPSSLSIVVIELILKELYDNFTISDQAEITFEINPDDVDLDYLKSLKLIGVNRLSIGIQSFNDDTLKFLNRRHTAKQAINVVNNAIDVGFCNISIDLIYGIPNQNISHFINDLNLFKSFKLKHLSAYHLIIEDKTHFGRMLKKGSIVEVKETKSLQFYNELIQFLSLHNYEHYEISSFTLKGFYSKHNTNYWKNTSYIGLGPSAHSYDGTARFWNVSSVKTYIKNINDKESYFKLEKLSIIDKFNEYIITGLRTLWGCDLEEISNRFGNKFYIHSLKILDDLKDGHVIVSNDSKFNLKEEYLIQSDFYIEKFIFEN